jgi:hypothetical protein
MNRIWTWIGHHPCGGDSPGQIVKVQPIPIEVRVSRIKVASGWVTAIARKWLYEDVPDCRLCEKGSCCAVGGECIFLVNEHVSDADAPLYAIKLTERQGPC